MPTTFANTIDGNDIFAKRAECDAAGNDLSTTYATKSELPEGVPAVTSSDNNKVLKASYSGGVASYSWQPESGGGGGGSYTAGTGIDITNDVISVDTSVVATQTDLSDKEDVFAVGTGLEMDTSGATPTLQVEAPVDIVAGPGIVIDNPDGNTMRISMGIAGSWIDVKTEASYNTTNINAGSFKIMYNPALNLVSLTCDANVGAGESTFFTWSNRLKPVFNDMALGSNLYVGQSGLKQAAGSTSRWINGAFMWPVVGGN